MERLVTAGATVEQVVQQAHSSRNPLANPFQSERTRLEGRGRAEPRNVYSKCSGTGWESVEGNDVRQVRRCSCSIEQEKRQLLSLVPVRYRDARLETLTPCLDTSRCFAPPEIQERSIALLKNRPDDSYCLLGGVGIGKSHYLAALYRHAVETQGTACYFVQASELVKGFREIEFGSDHEPYLCVPTIRRAIEQGLRPRIFIDELEKIPTFSQFSWAKVSEFFDVLYRLSDRDSKALQLCVASNLDRTEFEEFWGGAILRRLQELCTMMDFFEVAETAVK